MDNVDGSRAHQVGALRLALRNFTTQWFLIPQGTGILGVILHNLDYQFHGLAIISQILWVLTIVTLVGFCGIYVVRGIVWPQHVAHQLRHNTVESAGLASICVAFTTIIQMITLNLVSSWDPAWGVVAYALWWINAAMVAVACIGIPYVNAYFNSPGFESVPPNTLLPPIAALTIAAGGGVVASYGQLDAGHTLPLIIVSYLFIGIGFLHSILIDAIILLRLFNHQTWPSNEMVYPLMMLCGPPGQGSFALQSLGNAISTHSVFANYPAYSPFISMSGGSTVAIISQFLGLFIWGYGIFWWGFACIAILHYLFTSPREVLNWRKVLTAWSLVFPWGVYTNAAVQLGVALNSRAFKVWSTVLALLLVIIWLGNMAMTIVGTLDGAILGLDRGWRAQYSISGAEMHKDNVRQAEDESRDEDGTHTPNNSRDGLRQRL